MGETPFATHNSHFPSLCRFCCNNSTSGADVTAKWTVVSSANNLTVVDGERSSGISLIGMGPGPSFKEHLT